MNINYKNNSLKMILFKKLLYICYIKLKQYNYENNISTITKSERVKR